jgi:hypothetical protein
MAKSAAKRPAKAPPKPKRGAAVRPVLLAVGLGLYWFVKYQDADGPADVPMWAYLTAVGARVAADVVGAWVVVSALQLALVLSRLGFTYLRNLWPQESGR